jgi:diaminopimelate epimerase
LCHGVWLNKFKKRLLFQLENINMQFTFHKYHGTGNDFIISDNRLQTFDIYNHELIKLLCDRHFGIGADGMILLEENKRSDFHMRYFNSDGREGSMCGNGGRCIAYYAREIGLINKQTAIFSGIDGMHEALIGNDGLINLRMRDVTEWDRDGKAFIINTGSPHYVIFNENIDLINVIEEGRKIRYSKPFAEKGINVNFVEPGSEAVRLRTYERGVENETLSCGTGSVAAAICTVIEKGIVKNSLTVNTPGGKLEVRFVQSGKSAFSEIWLTGPVNKVFTGVLEIDELRLGGHHP